MKKVVALFLIVSLSLGLFCSCSKEAGVSEPTALSNTATTSNTTTTVIETTEVTTESTSAEDTAAPLTENDESENVQLNEKQVNSVNALNSLMVLSQELYNNRKSRIFLDQAYDLLKSKINYKYIDEETLEECINLWNDIFEFKMIDIKRERLDYLYELKQSEKFTEAIPSPLSIMNIVQSDDKLELALSAIYLVIDAVDSYKVTKQGNDLEYLQDGWQLDDKELQQVHTLYSELSKYRFFMVNEYDLPDGSDLDPDEVEEFVNIKNNENIKSRIISLENNKDVYKYFGSYWLVLADSYYDDAQYEKCLDALSEYEGLGVKFFNKDTDYAKTLSKAICAANKLYKDDVNKNEKTVLKYTKAIVKNCDNDDWALLYFVAQSYINLYAKTEKTVYLEEAYKIVKNSVNELRKDQIKLNKKYLGPVEEYKLDDTPTKEERDQAKKYNKAVKEQRKSELPPVSEALCLNCELLFALADKLNKNEDKKTINSILGKEVFIVCPLREKFTFNLKNKSQYDIAYDSDTISIPVKMLTDKCKIEVNVVSNGKTRKFSDWKIIEVKRNKSEDINKFTATFKSESAKKFKYSNGDKVTVSITPTESLPKLICKIQLKTSIKTTLWVFDKPVFKKEK